MVAATQKSSFFSFDPIFGNRLIICRGIITIGRGVINEVPALRTSGRCTIPARRYLENLLVFSSSFRSFPTFVAPFHLTRFALIFSSRPRSPHPFSPRLPSLWILLGDFLRYLPRLSTILAPSNGKDCFSPWTYIAPRSPLIFRY